MMSDSGVVEDNCDRGGAVMKVANVELDNGRWLEVTVQSFQIVSNAVLGLSIITQGLRTGHRVPTSTTTPYTAHMLFQIDMPKITFLSGKSILIETIDFSRTQGMRDKRPPLQRRGSACC
jgi:hypothetical protein